MKPPVKMTDAGLAEWNKLTEEEQLARTRRHFHTQILMCASRLRAASQASPEVVSQAHWLIELGAAKLMATKGAKDIKLRDAIRVLTGSQPGRNGAASKYRRIGERVKRWADYQFPPPGAQCDPPDADRWAEGAHNMACDLEGIDPAFREVEENVIARVLADYRATKSKQGLIDAVTALCTASKALGTSRLVHADGSEGATARRRLRDSVYRALDRKK